MKMPLMEARDRFTLSEMAMMSWRSQEQYWQMKNRMGERPGGTRKRKRREPEADSRFVGKRDAAVLKRERGERIMYDDPSIDTLPDRFFNEEGELDLSKVTGMEAVKYMNMQSQELNLPLFPVIGGRGGR